jgi:hypothetical protein
MVVIVGVSAVAAVYFVASEVSDAPSFVRNLVKRWTMHEEVKPAEPPVIGSVGWDEQVHKQTFASDADASEAFEKLIKECRLLARRARDKVTEGKKKIDEKVKAGDRKEAERKTIKSIEREIDVVEAQINQTRLGYSYGISRQVLIPKMEELIWCLKRLEDQLGRLDKELERLNQLPGE